MLGGAAFVLLIPLAVTSNRAAMKALGRRWQQLHCVVYAVAVLSLAHMWLQLKVGHGVPLPLQILLVALVAARVLAWRLGDRGAGVEVKERPPDRGRPA